MDLRADPRLSQSSRVNDTTPSHQAAASEPLIFDFGSKLNFGPFRVPSIDDDADGDADSQIINTSKLHDTFLALPFQQSPFTPKCDPRDSSH